MITIARRNSPGGAPSQEAGTAAGLLSALYTAIPVPVPHPRVSVRRVRPSCGHSAPTGGAGGPDLHWPTREALCLLQARRDIGAVGKTRSSDGRTRRPSQRGPLTRLALQGAQHLLLLGLERHDEAVGQDPASPVLPDLAHQDVTLTCGEGGEVSLPSACAAGQGSVPGRACCPRWPLAVPRTSQGPPRLLLLPS